MFFLVIQIVWVDQILCNFRFLFGTQFGRSFCDHDLTNQILYDIAEFRLRQMRMVLDEGANPIASF